MNSVLLDVPMWAILPLQSLQPRSFQTETLCLHLFHCCRYMTQIRIKPVGTNRKISLFPVFQRSCVPVSLSAAGKPSKAKDRLFLNVSRRTWCDIWRRVKTDLRDLPNQRTLSFWLNCSSSHLLIRVGLSLKASFPKISVSLILKSSLKL